MGGAICHRTARHARRDRSLAHGCGRDADPQQCPVSLEIKRGLDGSAYKGLPEHLLHVLHKTGFLDRAVVTSFHWSDLERVRMLAPQLPLVWLLNASATSGWCEASAEAAKHLHRTMIGVRYDRLTPELRQRLSSANLDLCCFGANDLAGLEVCFKTEPWEISTDRPDLALLLREGRWRVAGAAT